MLVWPLHGETSLENGDSMSNICTLDVYCAEAHVVKVDGMVGF